MVIQPWCICDRDNGLVVSSPLFCLYATFGVKLSGGNAAPFTPALEYRFALGEDISSNGCMGTKLEGYWLQLILWDISLCSQTTGERMNTLPLPAHPWFWGRVTQSGSSLNYNEVCSSPFTFLCKDLHAEMLLLVHVREDQAHKYLHFIWNPGHGWNLICFTLVICSGVNFIQSSHQLSFCRQGRETDISKALHRQLF